LSKTLSIPQHKECNASQVACFMSKAREGHLFSIQFRRYIS
jgi:hypothetical protein